MTLTFAGIARARLVLVTVAGEEKREALARVRAGDPTCPGSHVRADQRASGSPTPPPPAEPHCTLTSGSAVGAVDGLGRRAGLGRPRRDHPARSPPGPAAAQRARGPRPRGRPSQRTTVQPSHVRRRAPAGPGPRPTRSRARAQRRGQVRHGGDALEHEARVRVACRPARAARPPARRSGTDLGRGGRRQVGRLADHGSKPEALEQDAPPTAGRQGRPVVPGDVVAPTTRTPGSSLAARRTTGPVIDVQPCSVEPAPRPRRRAPRPPPRRPPSPRSRTGPRPAGLRRGGRRCGPTGRPARRARKQPRVRLARSTGCGGVEAVALPRQDRRREARVLAVERLGQLGEADEGLAPRHLLHRHGRPSGRTLCDDAAVIGCRACSTTGALVDLPLDALHGPGPGRPRRRPRPPGHLLAEGVHPADDAVPRPLRLLHLRPAAGPARVALPHARTRCSPSPAPAPRPGATRRSSPSARLPRTATPSPPRGSTSTATPRTVDYLAAMCRLVLDETGPAPPRQRRRARPRPSSQRPAGRRPEPGDDGRVAPRRPRLPPRRARQGPRPAPRHARGRRRARHPVHHRHPRRHRRGRGRPHRGARGHRRRATAATATCRR